MRGFDQPVELGCRDQRDVARPSPPYNHCVLLIYHLVEHGSQILAQATVRRFSWHGSLVSIVQDSCTFTGETRRLGCSGPWPLRSPAPCRLVGSNPERIPRDSFCESLRIAEDPDHRGWCRDGFYPLALRTDLPIF